MNNIPSFNEWFCNLPDEDGNRPGDTALERELAEMQRATIAARLAAKRIRDEKNGVA